jgi:hypothetical protein
MKPGPPRSCTCGACCLCRKRASHMAYYHRNAEKVARKNAETKARRKAKVKAGPPDQELDRRAAEWLANL